VPSSYDPRYFELLAGIEDRHFWFRARNQVIARVVQKLTRSWPDGYRVLEVGCGNGNVLKCLAAASAGGTVLGMDLFEEALRYAKQRTGCALVRGDICNAPLRPGFELIGLFDVLEHLEDDHKILGDLHRLLAPHGTLLLTVPAHMSLWSYFDVGAQHRRRYSRAELSSKLKATGFEVVYISEFMAPLFPLIWIGRRLRKFLQRASAGPETAHELTSGDFKIVPVVNEMLAFILRLEARLIARRWTIPIGTSLLAIARKDDGVPLLTSCEKKILAADERG
jgi:SAM-dependent methyltransferase